MGCNVTISVEGIQCSIHFIFSCKIRQWAYLFQVLNWSPQPILDRSSRALFVLRRDDLNKMVYPLCILWQPKITMIGESKTESQSKGYRWVCFRKGIIWKSIDNQVRNWFWKRSHTILLEAMRLRKQKVRVPPRIPAFDNNLTARESGGQPRSIFYQVFSCCHFKYQNTI